MHLYIRRLTLSIGYRLTIPEHRHISIPLTFCIIQGRPCVRLWECVDVLTHGILLGHGADTYTAVTFFACYTSKLKRIPSVSVITCRRVPLLQHLAHPQIRFCRSSGWRRILPWRNIVERHSETCRDSEIAFYIVATLTFLTYASERITPVGITCLLSAHPQSTWEIHIVPVYAVLRILCQHLITLGIVGCLVICACGSIPLIPITILTYLWGVTIITLRRIFRHYTAYYPVAGLRIYLRSITITATLIDRHTYHAREIGKDSITKLWLLAKLTHLVP